MTEPKTALAGRTLEVFARSRASMAAFRSASHSLGRWEPAFIVKGCSWERTALREGCEDVIGL